MSQRRVISVKRDCEANMIVSREQMFEESWTRCLVMTQSLDTFSYSFLQLNMSSASSMFEETWLFQSSKREEEEGKGSRFLEMLEEVPSLWVLAPLWLDEVSSYWRSVGSDRQLQLFFFFSIFT